MKVITGLMGGVLLVFALVAVCCTPVSASSLFVGAPSPTMDVPNTVNEFSVSGSTAQYQQNLTISRSNSFFNIKGMAVDASNRTLFVTNNRYHPTGYNITVINATTMQPVTSLSLSATFRAGKCVFDQGHDRLYVYDTNGGDLVGYTWDSDNLTLTPDGMSIPLSEGCNGLDVDPDEYLLYVITYDGTIQKYSSASGVFLGDVSLPVDTGAYSLTVDDVTHCLYMETVSSDQCTYSLLRLDPYGILPTRSIVYQHLDQYSYHSDLFLKLAVDPASHYLYAGTTRKVSDDDDPLMIPELRIYDSDLNLQNTIPVGPPDITATRDDHLLVPGYLAILSDGIVPPTPTPTSAITANFYAFGHVGQAPYSVRFLDQSTGSPTAWKWDFGDNTTSTEQNPTHVYNRTGAYNVALTASNDQASDTCTQYRCVIVNAVPAANFTANTTAGKTPLTVQFTDKSTSGADGYQWQFGDGATSTDKNPVHTYMTPGSYSVMLTVSEPDYGSVFVQKPGYITVGDPSTIGFSANVTAGLSPLAVQFNESVNGSVQYSFWHFGDGSTSMESNPVHVYDTPGRYTVSLMTVGSNGTETKTIDDYINVTSPVTPTPTVTTTSTVTPTPTGALPVANFTVTAGAPGSLAIQVIDTSVNATSVSYDLGDGTTTAAYRNFQFTYWQAGTYTIEQTATNAVGSSHKTLTVTVPAAAPTTTPTVTPTTTTTVSPTVTGNPYNGPHTIPGTLQAEDYDLGGEGVAYHDTTPGNEGGVYRHDDVDIEQLDTDGSPNVGWIRAGEWMAYTVNVSTTGTYNAGFRVASSHSGSSVQVYVDDGTTPVATVSVPNTGDWPAFRTVQVPVTLPAGQHRLKLAFPTDYVNINWIAFA
jgi:PKD repeat protein